MVPDIPMFSGLLKTTRRPQGKPLEHAVIIIRGSHGDPPKAGWLGMEHPKLKMIKHVMQTIGEPKS